MLQKACDLAYGGFVQVLVLIPSRAVKCQAALNFLRIHPSSPCNSGWGKMFRVGTLSLAKRDPSMVKPDPSVQGGGKVGRSN
eukprot:4767127-Amphidinium_carterae.1